jgi:hypothetical protein
MAALSWMEGHLAAFGFPLPLGETHHKRFGQLKKSAQIDL